MRGLALAALAATVIISISVTTISAQSDETIPSWIKTTAGWWSDGQIDDSDFVKAIEFLINEGIILVPTAEKDSQTIVTSDEVYQLPKYKQTTSIDISGFISNYKRGTTVDVLIIKPNGEEHELSFLASKDGFYGTTFDVPHNAQTGEYSLFVSYGGFTVDSRTISLVEDLSAISKASKDIPPWIKNNAGWWSKNQIGESDFLNSMQWLIENNIIHVTKQDEVLDVSDEDSEETTLEITESKTKTFQYSQQDCSGSARCFTGQVTEVIDEDTIRVDGQSIRFALASTPELSEYGGHQAKKFVEQVCPVGSEVLVDEDDGQTQGSYGRIIALIYCNGNNLNELVIVSGFGSLETIFCYNSEFSSDSWAQNNGCTSSASTESTSYECPPDYPYEWSDGYCYDQPEFYDNGCPNGYPYLWSDGLCYTIPEIVYDEPEETTPSCDPSYPTVCIAPYPPDLDCDEIPYSNFVVVGSDPHGFDADYDGIGCEVGSPQDTAEEPSTPECDPSYPDVCIPPYPPDLDCGEIPYKNFRVVGSDPHGFDGDKDGIGCES